MNRFFAGFVSTLLLSAQAQEVRPLNLEEVYGLIRTNLTDLSPAELSNAAAVGLIKELGTKVQLVTNNAAEPQVAEPSAPRRTVYNGAYPCLQVEAVTKSLPGEVQKWLSTIQSTNNVRGLILDLRFARGSDYEAAAKIADQFIKGGQPLFELGTNKIVSTDKDRYVDLPVAVLANKQTSGAAEALAAVLRENGAGLIIGSATAGDARLFETFPLSNGEQLKIGTEPVKIGAGKPIPAQGVSPDLSVAVNPSAEKLLYQDPYRMVNPFTGQISATSTNDLANSTNRAHRFNEAELVRRHRSGVSLDDTSVAALDLPEKPVVNDPVLARALDFLKGISALQQHRPLDD